MSPLALGFATEVVVSLHPFTVRRIPRWSECDPAGVVFTGNFTGYLLSAVQMLRRHLSGDADAARAPAKAVSLVFHRPLPPEVPFDLSIRVSRIGRHTVTFAGRATQQGRLAFEGSLTSIFVEGPMTEARARGVPDGFRAALEDYESACLRNAEEP